MALLNYTTTIEVAKTLGEIQALLAKAGASRVALDYAAGIPAAIEFEATTAIGVRPFRLPVDLEAIRRTLIGQHNRGVRGVTLRHTTHEQAARVAWRIVKDWLEAQLAIIETGMVSLDQVMLPYLLDDHGRTLHEAFVKEQLALPGGRAREGGRG